MKTPRTALLASALVLFCSGLLVTSGWSVFQPATAITGVTRLAGEFLESLEPKQHEQAVLSYDSELRVNWHFIPMETRKGLKLRDMTEPQRDRAYKLLQTCLSEAGYTKARGIMNLEKLLYSLEAVGQRERRDDLKYYFTFFGDPRQEERWGISIEGHHLSLNFVFEGDRMVASTPQFFAANPAVIKTQNSLGFEQGKQILRDEQELAFQLVQSLTAEQQRGAIIDAKAPKEIRNAGAVHPPQEPASGIPAAQLLPEQQKMLRQLIDAYAGAIPPKVAALRLKQIEEDGFKNVHFAWAGATQPGIGHYYRIQGESFLIEFVNTQPDAAGNPANHIHCVWRDMHGDFALSAE
ncbi:MAG: DUF3500 domain-containing protein [Planctomycetaceae bacterium]|nr:DUF3500 domain-containing protein [Planctomycetaceae bacterium]